MYRVGGMVEEIILLIVTPSRAALYVDVSSSESRGNSYSLLDISVHVEFPVLNLGLLSGASGAQVLKSGISLQVVSCYKLHGVS